MGNNSPLVHRALRDLYQHYERIYYRVYTIDGWQSLSLAEMDDDVALEAVKAMLEGSVTDNLPIYRLGILD